MCPLVRDSLQCPVCFKDFTPETINAHLDVCLLETSTISSPSAADESGSPPEKKPRVSAEHVNKSAPSSSSGTHSSIFPLFQTSGKLDVQAVSAGVFTSKQSPGRADRKRIKQTEAEFGPAAAAGGLEALHNQRSVASVANSETLKKTSNDLTPQTSLTFNKPLAETLRPNTLQEYFGQSKVVGQQTLIRSLLDSQEVPSLILWGPPGCGKVCR